MGGLRTLKIQRPLFRFQRPLFSASAFFGKKKLIFFTKKYILKI
jgi:hypothetical protein